MFFSDIERNQVDGEALAILRYLASQGEGAAVSLSALAQQFPNPLEDPLDRLIQRELIEMTPEGYILSVELIRRWFL